MTILKYLRIYIICSCLALLVACGTTQKQHDAAETPPRTEQSSPENLISEAQTTRNTSLRAELYLRAAKLYFENGLAALASNALNLSERATLPTSLQSQHFSLALSISLQQQNYTDTKKQLNAIPYGSLLRDTLENQQNYIQEIVSAYTQTEQPLLAAVTLSEFSGIFPLEDTDQLNEHIWLLLRQSSTDQLTQYSYIGDNSDVIGWLDLAKRIKLNQASIEQQHANLQDWKKDWAGHPATHSLPLEMQLLDKLPESRPNTIVLALPLSGQFAEAGQAVRDGFLAGYYQNNSSMNATIEIFDTNERALSEAYATYENTNTLIIGPLLKNTLEEVANSGLITLPTLALNSSTDIDRNSLLFMFGLKPESEIKQIAKTMANRGLSRTALLIPNTTNGQRLGNQFEAEFKNNQGKVLSVSTYDEEQRLGSAVSKLLATSQSKSRKTRIQNITGIILESEPRRRQDIDSVFIISDNLTAKQIKPLLAFNFARTLPVYATSSVHDPFGTDENNDLNGINFVDIPWMLTKTNPIRNAIELHKPINAQQYSRFYAFGADAYALYPRLELLQEIPNSHIDGQTGQLSIIEHGQVERKLQWAKYARGQVITIN